MAIFKTLLVVAQVLSALGVIGLVLLQHGKGADVGAAFGSGASGSLFGASGSANFLSRTTAVLAAVFFFTTFVLSYLVTHKPQDSGGVMDAVKEQPQVPPQQQPSQVPSAQSAPEAARPGAAPNPKANEVPK